jgi:hypothetical protein
VAVPDLDGVQERRPIGVERGAGVTPGGVGEHRERFGGLRVSEELLGRARGTEERERLAPDGNVHEALRVLVFHARHHEHLVRARSGAGLSVRVPAVVVEPPVVLRGEDRVVLALAKGRYEVGQPPLGVVRPLRVHVRRDPDRPHCSDLSARRAKKRTKLHVSATNTPGSERRQL